MHKYFELLHMVSIGINTDYGMALDQTGRSYSLSAGDGQKRRGQTILRTAIEQKHAGADTFRFEVLADKKESERRSWHLGKNQHVWHPLAAPAETFGTEVEYSSATRHDFASYYCTTGAASLSGASNDK